MGRSADIPIPEQLAPDFEASFEEFVEALDREVGTPLFATRDVAALRGSLDAWLARGAVLRLRWSSNLPPDQADPRAWPQTTADDFDELRRAASRVLGAERSFMVQRALELVWEGMHRLGALVRWWAAPSDGARWLVELARVAEVGIPHDVLTLCWVLALAYEEAPPEPEVADVLADALLRATAERERRVAEVTCGEVLAPGAALDVEGLDDAWLEAHPALVAPLLVLMGLALDEPATRRVVVEVRPDPEEEGLTLAAVLVQTHEDPDELFDRIEARALRTGALGSLVDDRGGLLCLGTERLAR